MTIREAVVAEARTWLSTPFVDQQRLKGCGCDCGQFLAGVYEAVGVLKDLDFGYYSPMHHLNSTDEMYLRHIEKYAYEIPEAEALAADIVIYKVGRTFSHAALILEWPVQIIHAVKIQRGVVYSDPVRDRFLTCRPKKFYRINTL